MHKTLKITRIGNSAGVILPKEMLTKLRADVGDSISFSETASGFRVSPYDPEFERQMDLAEKIMRENRDTLRALVG
ncbi:AbrB/MazE/SpoVT family DNA-binding domain-containing protein [Croceibacterium aestuarii]|uniref:AbrB/MazE/SpoVT family DNA-binding domain-containing protein n=1 Tax=Croceibacterium aestuarii TaxID=3064139 RepID=UPI00272E9536|nr:AbrB/MazE/SpoVT family DNA-binding domain-containing protein [Croceibacterium sp. D39]